MTRTIWLPLSFVWLSATAIADQTFSFPPASVVWNNPDSYRDVRSTSGSQSRFQQHVFERLSECLGEMARIYLPPDSNLTIKVDNLDLAGDVRYGAGTGQHLRVLTSISAPSISFSYQIRQGEKTMASDTVKLINLNYQASVRGADRNRALAYEKQLIHDWARKTFTKR